MFRTAAAFFTLLPPAAMAALPPVLLVENHGEVLVHWVRTGVRGAVAVNVDAHDDCAPISPAHADKLRTFLAAGNVAAIGRANSTADSSLYGIGDWITAAYALGIAHEALWVPAQPKAPVLAWTHIPIRTCPLESLPPLKGPVLLTVDSDIVPRFAKYRCINEIEAIRRVAKTLRAVPWNVVHLSVCYSVDGGFLPMQLRWVGNAMKEALEGKDPSRPKAPWPLLDTVEDWRNSLMPSEIVRRVRPLVRRQPANPWLHVDLADALFRAGDVTGAMDEGLKATRLDPACCRILLEFGRQLADDGHIDDAERFLAAAPAVINANAELALAQALDRAGRTARAIEHYSRMRKQVANYCAELLMGYGYERLGDTAQAHIHYLAAVTLLTSDIMEMPGYPGITPSLLSAERFLRASGDQKKAQTLRQEPRLAPFFIDEGNGGGTGR